MTIKTEEETLILKTDALGRVRMPADRREAILDAFERSGMSGQAFSERIGVKYPTFATWEQKRRKARGENPLASSARGADQLHRIVKPEFTGTLQCDGYQAYTSFQKQRAGPLELAACWAHVRRKFFEAKDRDPQIASWILRQIRYLYRVEARLREQHAGPRLRLTTRRSDSAPVMRRLKKALFKLKPRYLPQNAMGKAIAYAFSQWSGLELFLENGAIEIDNNLVENAIRPTKLGMKNWLFLGSEGSGQASAILFTIVESAKRYGLEPYGYLRHLLEVMPRTTNWQLHQLLPVNHAKATCQKSAA